MLRIADERLFALSDQALTRNLPRRRRGRRPHVSTFYRWATRGLRGVRLETLRVGTTMCTSLEAVQRFFDALTHQQPNPYGVGLVKARSGRGGAVAGNVVGSG